MPDDRTHPEPRGAWIGPHVSLMHHDDRVVQTWLERWKVDLDPIYQAIIKSREFSFGYAGNVIRSLFILNGGALVAFPAFAGLIEVPIGENLLLAILALTAFILGLVLVVAGSIAMAMAMELDKDGLIERAAEIKHALNGELAIGERQDRFFEAAMESSARSSELRKRVHRRTTVAVSLGIASLLVFVAGAILAAVWFGTVSVG